MKKIIYWVATVFLAASVSSCELDRDPEGKDFQQPYTSFVQTKQNRDGLYALLRNTENPRMHFYQELQSDMYCTTITDGNSLAPFVNWDLGILNDHGRADEDEVSGIAGYYFVYNRLNQQANAFVNNTEAALQNQVYKNSTEIANAKSFLAEGKVLQALAIWRLMDRFSFHESVTEVNSGAKDLGVILLKEYNPGYIGPRATKAQCYDYILSRLSEAIEVLPENRESVLYVSRDYAYALRARIYLALGEYGKAAADAKMVVDKYPLIGAANASEFENIYRSDANNPEIIFRGFASATLGSFTATTLNGAAPAGKDIKYKPSAVPFQWVVDLYENEDFRKSVYIAKVVKKDKGYLVNKFLEDKAYRDVQDKPNLKVGARYFSVAEVYLILVESALQTGDTPTAEKYLKALSKARGAEVSVVNMEALQAERTRELIGEGSRLRDMVRWSIPNNHDAFETQPGLEGFANTTPLKAQAPVGFYAYTWEFPQRDRQTNPQLIKNWPI